MEYHTVCFLLYITTANCSNSNCVLIDRLWLVLICAVTISTIFFIKRKETGVYGIVIKSFCFGVLLALFLNTTFYPQLLQYQGGMMAGKWQQQHLPNTTITMYKCNQYSFEFYGNATPLREEQLQKVVLNGTKHFILTHKNEVAAANTDSFSIKTLAAFNYFHISALDASFFNYKTRNTVLDTLVIAEVGRKY